MSRSKRKPRTRSRRRGQRTKRTGSRWEIATLWSFFVLLSVAALSSLLYIVIGLAWPEHLHEHHQHGLDGRVLGADDDDD